MRFLEDLFMWGGLLLVAVFMIVFIGTFCIAIKDLFTTYVKDKEEKHIDKDKKV